jgi:acetate kinase
MHLLTINSGSSSVRLAVFSCQDDELRQLSSEYSTDAERTPEETLRAFLRTHEIDSPTAVAHRVVHGGTRFQEPCRLDAKAEAEIARLSFLAPLHNPKALRWIESVRAALGAQMPQFAVFDTAFYATLPTVAATYALPRELCERHHIRRFGFHGLAHQAMVRRWQQLRPDLANGGRTISLQLGAGCSITACENGQPRDTSMGFSPLEGLVMAKRPGDVDAGTLLFLQREAQLSWNQIEELLNHQSGLLGVSGQSADMRILLESDSDAARLAVELYCYRARKYIGAYLAVLGGADAILFGGGVGENSSQVRERILSGLEWCGLTLDSKANEKATGQEACISAASSPVAAWVVPVDESVLLAQETCALLNRS